MITQSIILVLFSSLTQQVTEASRDIFFSKNQMNFNLNKCYEQVLVTKNDELKPVIRELDLRIKYRCKTLLNYRTSLECQTTVIENKRLAQAPSFKPKWPKNQRKLADVSDNWTREITWDAKGNVMEVTLISNGGLSNKQRICYGRAF